MKKNTKGLIDKPNMLRYNEHDSIGKPNMFQYNEHRWIRGEG